MRTIAADRAMTEPVVRRKGTVRVQNMQVVTFSDEMGKIIGGDNADLPKSRPGFAMDW